jgi:hypothetical protein
MRSLLRDVELYLDDEFKYVYGDMVEKPAFQIELFYPEMSKADVINFFADRYQKLMYFFQDINEEIHDYKKPILIEKLYNTKYGNMYNPKVLKDFFKEIANAKVDRVETEVIEELKADVKRLTQNHRYISELLDEERQKKK